MLIGVRKSLMSSSESTFDAKLSPNTIPKRNFWYTLSFLGTGGCRKQYWISLDVRLFEFFWSCVTMWIVLKITTRNVVRLLSRCAWTTCRLGPLVVQCQPIDVIASFSKSLSAQLSSKSFSLCTHYHVSMESFFTLFSMVFSIRSLLAITKVGLWLTVVMCFK
jgi:hypothetical protein